MLKNKKPEKFSDTHNKYEKCVVCGTTTNVPKNTPIERRYGYVEGAGQMCDKCARKFGD